MNAKEKLLIEGIIHNETKEEKRIHNRCIQLLFHGIDDAKSDKRAHYKKNRYVESIEKAVRTNFIGGLYQGKFPEVYMVFESLFVTYLERLNPEKLREIVDLENWLFIAAGNFCNSNRKEINKLLGIEIGNCFEEFDDNSKVEDQNDETTVDGKSTDEENDIEPSDELVKEADTSGWAKSLIDFYIGKINNEDYRDLIRAIKLEKIPVETIAEEKGKTDDDIYRDYNRAWNKLLQVALPDIRIRCKNLFVNYESELNDEQAYLLNEFFFSGNDFSTIARSRGMKQYDLESAIVKAYKVLMKIAKRETELDEKEKRQEEREQRRLKKEEDVRRKEQQRDAKEKKSKLYNP